MSAPETDVTEPMIATCESCGEEKKNVYYPQFARCSHCEGSKFTFRKQLEPLHPQGPVRMRRTF